MEPVPPPKGFVLYHSPRGDLQEESACNNTMCALAHELGRVKMEASPTKLV